MRTVHFVFNLTLNFDIFNIILYCDSCLLPEAAEAQLPLKLEKDNQNSAPEDHIANEHNAESDGRPPADLLSTITQLNGSIKTPQVETLDVEESHSAPPPDEDHPHTLWKWPANRGKFTQVKILV